MAVIGELDRVAEQVEQHLAEPGLIGLHPCGRDGGASKVRLQLFGFGPRADDPDDAAQECRQLQRRGAEFQPAGLDLGQVEDVVDQGEQVLAALLDDVQAVDGVVSSARA